MSDSFTPPFYLKSTFAQTLLGSSKVRARGPSPMLASAQEVILNPSPGVRLQGFYSPPANRPARGVALLLHGWEGSVRSTYMLHTGRTLYDHGFAVFRLNYRDHGETHHLNPGLFYAVLLEEVFGAVQHVAQYERDLPFYLAGFSLGGNFALRIARRSLQDSIPNLKHIVSISPALDPEKSTYAIDAYPMLRRYFRQKWSRSLLKKQAHFPELYDFTDVLQLPTLATMTERMLERYSSYKSAADYFREYAVLGDALVDLTVPTLIITAQDDPIIPVADFYDLKLSPSTQLIVHRYGGHNGFLESVTGPAWYERKILEQWTQTQAD